MDLHASPCLQVPSRTRPGRPPDFYPQRLDPLRNKKRYSSPGESCTTALSRSGWVLNQIFTSYIRDIALVERFVAHAKRNLGSAGSAARSLNVRTIARRARETGGRVPGEPCSGWVLNLWQS